MPANEIITKIFFIFNLFISTPPRKSVGKNTYENVFFLKSKKHFLPQGIVDLSHSSSITNHDAFFATNKTLNVKGNTF